MTARHQIRLGNRRLGRDRAAIDATPAPSIGEVLQIAREKKGVDLFRAERDTKIRAKYLAALEGSDFDELPGAVYTKGFLRNYALYLGLDPDDVLLRWRDEAAAARQPAERVVAPPPRPIETPRRGLTFSRGIFVAGLVTLAVLTFVAYLFVQFLRFAEVPPVELTQPRNHTATIDADRTVLAGQSARGATIEITGPGGEIYRVTANENGEWEREVPLAMGRNEFSILARDPVTGRVSPPTRIVVSVPIPGETLAGSSASPTPVRPVALSLSLSSPAEGATLSEGRLTVAGRTNGTRVTIATQLLGPATATAPPSPATGSPPAPVRDISVPAGGAFSEQLTVEPGRWRVTVTTYATGRDPLSQARTVVVPEIRGLVVELTARGNPSWILPYTDGDLADGFTAQGRVLRTGRSVTLQADESIRLRVGNAGAIRYTQNGGEQRTLGRNGQVGTWIFTRDEAPRQAP